MQKPGEKLPDGFKSWKEYSQHRKTLKRKWEEDKLIKKQKKAEARQEKQAKEEAQNGPPPEISTLTIAVPGSILENAQSAELRAVLAGQIARAAAIFSVDEVVVFDDLGDGAGGRKGKVTDSEGEKIARKSCVQLARILQYLECPQYLRKFFFPLHDDLKYAGLLNPLDAPHHLRADNDFPFREGVTLNKNVKPGRGSQVNVGLQRDVSIDRLLDPNVRVTVKMSPSEEGSKKLKGKAVGASVPRAETGVYWGYSVRLAKTLSEVFSGCPYKKGYDVTVGTSDRGVPSDSIEDGSIKFKHALIVFGGLQGIDGALENDELLTVDDPSLLFDHYVNAVPSQGSRTIRTEEAILITLSALRTKMEQTNKVREFTMTDRIAQSCDPSLSFNKTAKTQKNDKDTTTEKDMSIFD